MSPTLDAEFSEATLIEMRALPDAYTAQLLDSHLRLLEQQWKRSFISRGLILIEMKQRQLWKHVLDRNARPFTSLESWIVDAAPQSRSDCYAAMRAVEELRDIPREQLADIPRCNVATLRLLSSAVRSDPDVIEAAKNLSEKDFTARIEKDFPLQHIEGRRQIRFKLLQSDYEVVEQAIEMAMQDGACETREEALLAIAICFIGGD
jgi:hypothetical protein